MRGLTRPLSFRENVTFLYKKGNLYEGGPNIMTLGKTAYLSIKNMCEEDGSTFERGKSLLKAGFTVEEVAEALNISILRAKIYQKVIENEKLDIFIKH